MRMRTYHIAVCCVVLAAGCTQPAGPGLGGGSDPGRFTHSAVRKSVAPWDGEAIRLFLAEAPLDERKTGPHVEIFVYLPASSLSNQQVRLEGKETRKKGAALWVEGDKRTELAWAEIAFEAVRDGEPVVGKYKVALPDGKQAQGRFQAKWWASEGPGG